MTELSVGYVAGLIALASFVAQLWGPTAVTYMLAGAATETESAATWSFLGRALQSSAWPEFLRSDTALFRGVRPKIVWIASGIPITAALVAIAGIVTPLGLYDALEPSGVATPSFAYMLDTSPFGFGTAPRRNLTFSRSCSLGHGIAQGPTPCPYSNTTIVHSWNGSTLSWDFPDGYWTAVPPIVKEIYSSGTTGKTTVSNYFDIQWRQFSTKTDKYLDNGTAYFVGAYRTIDSTILKSQLLAIEGLVVDAKDGSIGFRNHTLPLGLKRGAAWKEDLLFVEPETVCVNTNLTLNFTINTNSSVYSRLSEMWLTDMGGFVNLNHTYPTIDRDHAQTNLDLWARAYKAAWLNNAWTMMYLNVTNPNNKTTGQKSFAYLNSTYGKQFKLPSSSTTKFAGMFLSGIYGGYLDLEFIPSSKPKPYPNPFKVSVDDFKDLGILCSGATVADIANISNVYVSCGMLQGAPQRIDGGSPSWFEGGSKWSSPLYSCASALKASIKTVSFLVNGTSSNLQSLAITDIQAKKYDDPNKAPLWGMEDSGLALDGVTPVWGIISDEYAKFPNISTVRKAALYLSGIGDTANGITPSMGLLTDGTFQNMPGGDFGHMAMNSVYGADFDPVGPVDYTASNSLAMFARWQNLSQSAERASSIINLIWTDYAAQAVVGSKGVLGPGNSGNLTMAVQVRPIVHKVKYRYQFGIPAYVLVISLVFITVMAFISASTGQSSTEIIKKRLWQSSTGRIYASFLYPAESNFAMPSLMWRNSIGRRQIDLAKVAHDLQIYASDSSHVSIVTQQYEIKPWESSPQSYSTHSGYASIPNPHSGDISESYTGNGGYRSVPNPQGGDI